ncbi:MAG: hypothetical protein KGL93_04995 [Gemmatimonadota bacterium]|nr:hypothetical protein [Gemmatimonadota bacterium]HEU4990250.1 hypothetical protein [Gemmatimonadaceae bacterium]
MNRLAMAVLAVAACVPAGVRAQGARAEFNFGAGATVPSGQFSDHNPMGYHVTAGVGVTPPGSSLGFRVEGLYDAFNGRDNYVLVCGGSDPCSRQSYAAGLTFNLKFEGMLPYNERPGERRRGGRSTLYVIGGYGIYDVRAATQPVFTPAGVVGYANRTRAYGGFNVGGGLRVPAGTASIYVEARLHTLSQDGIRFVPITLGVIF